MKTLPMTFPKERAFKNDLVQKVPHLCRILNVCLQSVIQVMDLIFLIIINIVFNNFFSGTQGNLKKKKTLWVSLNSSRVRWLLLDLWSVQNQAGWDLE